ncbi:T9SS type A sorting domain-containing protein [Chryseobacterium populi]|uniref:Por secretion system C-terminal sorting domain containing protein n=1 Tax=Chryseobacterium populi TaxID=1144316 RepID=J3CQB4_9FLAO|nr:T9SS type A sorting domain-containing protein [Chryseobacterium populi]EJL76076.1 Por secretion system C-terminal sorting domain containing protein [Chryseobacterium populi]
MKEKLLSVACLIFSGMLFNQINAQEYQPISIQSGFNADVIANGVGASASSTTNDVDGVNYAFVSRDFLLTSSSTPLNYGLPVNGIINSAVGSTSGLSYQMASYSGNNALRLQNTGDSGTLTLSTPIQALSLYMMATGGSGDCTVDVTVNFSDASTQMFTGISISDWYGGSNYAIQGIGRINLTNDVLESGNGTNPRLYQIPLAIDIANQSKNIQSVTVAKTGTGGIPNIFAFAADVYSSCPAPSNITYTSTMDGATFNWTAPTTSPSSGYDYYYSTSPTPPTATTTPTGTVGAGITTITLNGLATGQTFYFWVRSNCGSSQGFWKMKEFATGQISETYTLGDINTMFSSGTPDTTATTNCPGVLTVNVPAGYKIKSTSVSYTMTTAGNGWMAEQKSLLVCLNNSITEAAVTSGSGSTGGTFSYNRTNLTLANDLTGAVNFELRAWRTYGGSDCNADYNKVDNNTFKVTVTLEPLALGVNEVVKEKERVAYPNPFSDALHIENAANVKRVSVTDLSGITVRTIDNPSSTLHLGDIKSGIYILTLTMKDGSVKSSKMIKK